MNEKGKEKILDLVKAMDREEVAVFLQGVPIDLLWMELERKITELCDFKSAFEDLMWRKGDKQ